MQSCGGRRYGNSEWICLFGWSDVGCFDDNAVQGRKQKECRSGELRRALLILLLRTRAALIGLGLGNAVWMISGVAIRLDLIGALPIDTAIVPGLRSCLPAGTGSDPDAEERQSHQQGRQTLRHGQLRVSHRWTNSSPPSTTGHRNRSLIGINSAGKFH